MYTYTFTNTNGNLSIKTPHVDKFSDIKIELEKTDECIESHYEYPNGLILDITQYADKIIWVSNKRIILLENGSLGFED